MCDHLVCRFWMHESFIRFDSRRQLQDDQHDGRYFGFGFEFVSLVIDNCASGVDLEVVLY